MPGLRAILAIAATGGLAAGCSGDGGATAFGLPSASELNIGALPSLSTGSEKVVGTPTEVYTRVARGALTCWFGAAGPLKSSYIYHADADPPSKGGRSEIMLFERDADMDDPRSLRVYRVVISLVDEKAKLEVENLKIPEPLAVRLAADVARWAANEEGCGETPITAGWSAAEQASPPKQGKKAPPNTR